MFGQTIPGQRKQNKTNEEQVDEYRQHLGACQTHRENRNEIQNLREPKENAEPIRCFWNEYRNRSLVL